MYCTSCGKKKSQNAVFCPFCGAKSLVYGEDANVNEAAPRGEQPPRAEEPAAEPAHEASQAQWAREALFPAMPGEGEMPPRRGVAMPVERAAPPKNSVTIPKKVLWIAAGAGLLILGLAIGLLVGGRGGAGKDDKLEAKNSPRATSTPKQTPAEESDDLSGMAAEAAGFDLPEAGEGESLFFGKGSIKDAGDFRVAFVLSEDGNEIHDVTLFAKELNLDINQDGIKAKLSDVGIREHYSAKYPVGRSSTDIDLGGSKIYDLVFDGDTAAAEIDYVYTYRELSGSRRSTDIPLGSTGVIFELIDSPEGGGQSPGKTVKSVASSSGTVDWESKSYRVTLGEFDETDDGKLTVKINSPGIGSVLPFRNNKIVIPLQCAVVVDKKTVEWNRVTTTTDALTFEFNTKDKPQKVIVYPYGKGSGDAGSVTFDAVTGDVIS